MKIIPTCPPVEKLNSIGIERAKDFRKAAKRGFERGSCHISHDVMDFMGILNEIGEYYGVESLYPELPNLFYLNIGDTYAPTIFYNTENNRLFVSSMGDVIENCKSFNY